MEEKKHCKWYNDEFCTNGDSPCVADYCPCMEYPELCKFREENLVKEKKLTDDNDTNVGMTDEEIIKQYIADNEIYKRHGVVFKRVSTDTIIDLLHRLQDEKKGLQESADLFNHFNEKLNGVIAEQKAEIERLTEELDFYKGANRELTSTNNMLKGIAKNKKLEME